MKYRRKLFSVKDPYSFDDSLFAKASQENFIHITECCDDYRKIAEHYGVNADSIKTEEDIGRIPVLPTLLFKKRRISCKGPYIVRATSSGTRGKFSDIAFDAGGLLCGLKMVLHIAPMRGLISSTPCHYIVMGYKYHRGNRTAVTKTAFGATLFTPALSRRYILKYKNGGYSPDFEGIISALRKLEHSRFPARLMGFPAYTYFLMKMMEERSLFLHLPKGSKILLGGGWKQFYAERADKEEFYRLAEKVFGICDNDIVEFFGAVEHPILYCDCPKHHFHIPAYSRVIIRNVDTLEPLPMGEAGLVNLITPMVAKTPLLSVMTDDIGVLHPAEECGCGIKTPFLEILGRTAPEDIKTCAAGAEELLKGVKL
ncbi:MAG: acyl-protein synthetase [Ruminiclostridium sp.]